MCGRLNVIDSEQVQNLCEQLQISLWPKNGLIQGRFLGAASSISIVLTQGGTTQMANAIWWLLLDRTTSVCGDTFKPSKYTSFNTRYDKLNTPRSAGYRAFRESRCVIPVTGFGETNTVDGKKNYFDFVAKEGAMLLGGLYRKWYGVDGQNNPFTLLSCSVVTLPPHANLQQYHHKASPLMLSMHDGSAQKWLDTSIKHADALADLLTPNCRYQLVGNEVEKPSQPDPTGRSFTIEKD